MADRSEAWRVPWTGTNVGALLIVALLAPTTPSIAAEFSAGGFTFSDRLGGFRLLSATGSGTAADPIVVVEEFSEAAPVTLSIRQQRGSRLFGRQRLLSLTLEKVVVNRSNRVWAGFELELQEVRKRPSVYGDGLSFNQLAARAPDLGSDSFADAARVFEPADRIRFSSGHVDPEATARFRVTITDPTPRIEFYLVQDPKLLFAFHGGETRWAWSYSQPDISRDGALVWGGMDHPRMIAPARFR